jgi:Protein of unknown function (DUF551)
MSETFTEKQEVSFMDEKHNTLLARGAANDVVRLRWRLKIRDSIIRVLVAENQRLRLIVEQRQQWIPVSERLPALDERVMMGHDSDGWVAIGHRQLTGAYLHWDDDDADEMCDPTHWMPLPDAPEST